MTEGRVTNGRVTNTTGFTYDDRMLLHRDPEDDHPEQPARLESIIRRFQETELLRRCVRVSAGVLSENALAAVHTSQHMEFLASLQRTFQVDNSKPIQTV